MPAGAGRRTAEWKIVYFAITRYTVQLFFNFDPLMPPRLISGNLLRRGLPLLLAVNLLLLGFYLAIDYQLVYHSDAAVKNLLAQEIVETGQYFPRDWNYINSDLWVFYTHTFIIPLLGFMHNGYLAALVSDLITAALILHGTWLLSGLLELSRTARLAGMAVLSAGISLIMAEHVYGQAAYGSMYYMACYLLYSYWRLLRASGHARLLWGAASALVLILVFWANPQRALLYYGLPLLAAAALQQGLEWRAARTGARRVRWDQAGAILLALAAMAAGIAINHATLRHVHASAGLTVISWLDFNGMLKNLQAVINGLLALFDGLPRTNGKVASLAGVYAALRLVGALALLALLPWALRRALRPQQGSRQLVVVFTAVAFGASLFVMLTTTLADMSSPDASVRYLVPSLLPMLLILIGTVIDGEGLTPPQRLAGGAVLALLLTSGPTSLVYPYNEFTHLERRGLILQTPDQQVANFLREQGLKYGYATFWNAGKQSVLSAGQVRVRQIEIERGLPQPLRKLSSNRWYQPSAWRGESFLMLRESELPALDQDLLARLAGQPRVLRTQDMVILVYPGNLADVLPNWDLAAGHLEHFPISRDTPHQVGRLDPRLGALVAEPGESGALHFGPQRSVLAGSYDVGFDIETAGAGKNDFGFVDITTEAGHRVHARQTISQAGRQHVVLRLDTDQPLDQLEFRVFSSGQGQIIMRGVDFVRHAQEKS